MAKQMLPLPDAKSVRFNPSAEELKELAAQMPNAKESRHGNLNVQTEVLSRSKGSTFLRDRRPPDDFYPSPGTAHLLRLADRSPDVIAYGATMFCDAQADSRA
jgi:hypothetical protein